MPLWSTTLYLNMPDSAPKELSTTFVRCGLFQGDTLSPLLFRITLTSLSLLLDGYNTKVPGRLNHLLYMDDLKLYARSDTHLEALLCTVHMFSADVGLIFGLDKCAKLSVVRGKLKPSSDVVFPAGVNIRELSVGEMYKYLGLSLIWKSYLSGSRKVRATNLFCVLLLSYNFWTDSLD